MATYEFKCCGVTQEIVANIKEALPKPKCSVCNGDMQRVFTPAGIVFNASGFYKTDNR